MVFLRIGDFVFYPQSVMLPLAGLFFLVVAYKRLHARLHGSRAEAFLGVILAAAAALLGSRLWNGHPGAAAVVGGQASLAAYWGAFAGVVLWALLRRKNPAGAANAIAPAVMAGGAVARLGCVFAGCCRGIPPVFGPWPFYDIAALAIALGLGLKLEKHHRNAPLLAFLIGYGLLRFFLEFAREMPPAAFGLTAAQLLAAAQVAAGLALLAASQAQSPATEKENA